MFRRELELFFVAVTFLTRCPSPIELSFSEEALNRSARYYPLVGLLIGAFSGSIYLLLERVMPSAPSLVLAVSATVWLTGAFHEDGFADFCDGFGGGWTKEDILRIMKDSRSGSYAVVGTILLQLTKFSALLSLEPTAIFLALTSGHSFSRFNAVSFLVTDHYAREDETAKVKPLAKQISLGGLMFAGLFGIIPCLSFPRFNVVSGFVLVFVARYLFQRGLRKRLGGFTGDCLGAVQQLTEVIWYLALVIQL